MKPEFVLNSESGRYTEKSYRRNSAHMLPVTDWLSDLPEAAAKTDMIEVQFKNTRKGYYRNSEHLHLEKGMMVAVEGNPGHDVGEVTLVGQLVIPQMRKNRIVDVVIWRTSDIDIGSVLNADVAASGFRNVIERDRMRAPIESISSGFFASNADGDDSVRIRGHSVAEGECLVITGAVEGGAEFSG